MALRNESTSAMGTAPDDFVFVVEEYQEAQPEFSDMKAPIDKEGAEFFLNQNSREPVTEPDELVPLWITAPMDASLTIAELENRWELVLSATRIAVSRHPSVYRQPHSFNIGDTFRRVLS